MKIHRKWNLLASFTSYDSIWARYHTNHYNLLPSSVILFSDPSDDHHELIKSFFRVRRSSPTCFLAIVAARGSLVLRPLLNKNNLFAVLLQPPLPHCNTHPCIFPFTTGPTPLDAESINIIPPRGGYICYKCPVLLQDFLSELSSTTHSRVGAEQGIPAFSKEPRTLPLPGPQVQKVHIHQL